MGQQAEFLGADGLPFTLGDLLSELDARLTKPFDHGEGHLVPPPLAEELTVLLMDAGVIPDTRPPVVISRRRRLRWRIRDAREKVAEWAYPLIAGHEIERGGDDW
jgi:hypothetical protein